MKLKTLINILQSSGSTKKILWKEWRQKQLNQLI